MDKLICVGKNYLKHAQELGDQVPDQPLFFFKPPSCIFRLGQYEQLSLPTNLGEVHHELELVFKVKLENDGEFRLCAWTIGLDLTLRDLQTRLKKQGHPWERAKAFPSSAVIGEFQNLPEEAVYLNEPFELFINGKLCQRGFGKDMRWKPKELLEEIKQSFALCDGDLIFTGTPEGVGPLAVGDKIVLKLGSLLEHQVTCSNFGSSKSPLTS